MARSISEVLAPALMRTPEREALVGPCGRLSYRELDDAANQAAAALVELGVRPGDRVAASLPNGLDIVVAFHGVMRAGGVWVGVNRILATPEKVHILADANVVVFLGDDTTTAAIEASRDALSMLRHVVATAAASPTPRWGELLAGQRGAAPLRLDIAASSPAAIAYTSGTTGLPKGVVHTQHNLLLPGAALAAHMGWGAELRKLDCFPLTILNIVVLSTLLAAQVGGTSILLDTNEPAAVANAIADERITVFNHAPALMHALIADESVTADRLGSLRHVIAGGSATPEALITRFRQRFDLELLGCYGLTEAPTFVTCERPGEHVAGSSGRVLPHLEVVVVDAEDQPVPSGREGEICLRGAVDGAWQGVYTPMLGYLDRPEATELVLGHGQLHTGDIGHLDAEGRLFVTDRKTRVIVRGGGNVYPAEVERVVLLEPRVAACLVVGLPDERLGERIGAYVELVAGQSLREADLRAWCLRNLAPYKVPERFQYVTGFPRNAMGKIMRDALPVFD